MAISVTYEEMQNSPVESQDRSGRKTAKRRLLVDWGDRWTLMDELQDEEYEVEAGTGMICKSATSLPFNDIANSGTLTISAYEKAIVTAVYSKPTFEVDPSGVNITESIEPTAEFLTIDGTNLRWKTNTGAAVEKGDYPSKLFVGFDYVINKENLDTVPTSILTLIGKVNVATVRPTSQGLDTLSFSAQTLLYQPPNIVKSFNESGDVVWNVSYRLTYKPNIDTGGVKRGWNYFFFAESGAGKAGDFHSIHNLDGDQYTPYETGDFTTI